MTIKPHRHIMRFFKKAVCCAVALTTLLCSMPSGIITASAAETTTAIRLNKTTASTQTFTSSNKWNRLNAEGTWGATTSPINLLSQTGPIAVSVDIVANPDIQKIYFGSVGNVRISSAYDCSQWTKDSVHTVTMVFHPDTNYSTVGPKTDETYNIKSDLYVDNEAATTYTQALKNTAKNDSYPFSELRFYGIVKDGISSATVTFNAIRATNQISGDVSSPAIASDSLFKVSGSSLYSTTRAKVSAITSKYTNAKVFGIDGTEITNTASELTSGMKIKMSATYDIISLENEYTYLGRQVPDISFASDSFNQTYTTTGAYHGGETTGQMYQCPTVNNTSINFGIQKNPVAIQMEVSSKGALEKLFLGSSQACSVCPTIDTSKWKADEKHTITLVVYPDADYIENGSANGSAYNGTSTLFIDDKPAENSTWGQSAKFGAYSTYHYAELRFVWKYLSTATDTEKSITIHSYRVTNKIDGTISRPVFNAGSSGLAESQNKIYSYSGKKVSDITAANSGAKVYSGNTELGADASLAAGQKVVLTNTYDTVSLSTGYILAETDSGTFADTPQSFSDGYPSEKFTHEADFTVKTTVHSFGSNASVRAYLAQYDYEGRLIDVAMSDETAVSNNGSAEVSISFKPKKSAGTTLKFMVWDSDMKPCGSTVEFSPYSAQNPEVIATYKGFTNKAATFRFDDGISADGAVIASLDKFGAKSTFYAVGGWQGNSSHYMGYDASATDKVNWTKFKNAYKDHEVGNHTLEHTPAHLEEGQTSTDSYSNTLTGVSAADLVKAVNDNQTLLYEKTGITTRGIAWPNGLPFGRSDWGTILAGISLTHDYSISTNNATTFDTPKDWYQWQTNAYLPEMTAKTDKFIADDETSKLRLFFVWGHAYEVGSGDSVKISTTDFEANLKKLKDANVYFATNSEIYDYVNAVDDISVKAGTVTNKSNQTLYLIINGKKVTLAPNESHTPSSPLTIACWGDSLTYGQNSTNDATGENSYPAVLERMTGATVFNLGVGGETALTIAARQGVVEFTAGSAFTIPASGSVEIPFTSSTYESGNVGYFPATGTDSGGNVVPRPANSRPGRDGSWSPVTIAGVEGTLTANILYKDGVPRLMSSATFTRLKAGDAVSVSATDKIVSAASSIKADVNVFFTGTNGYQTVSGTNSTDLTSLVKRQIAATKNPEKYIVIGLTSGSTAAWGEQNTAFKTEFGDHFIDAKAYFTSEQALLDAGISADDVTHKENVAIPSNFLATDGVHFNDLGYKLLAGLVYDKLSELGYLND